MALQLTTSSIASKQPNIAITGSKSESNRLLILKALFNNISIENLSNSDDTKLMVAALNSASNLIDVHHAGTAMRFLTAFFSIQEGHEVTLTGSKRMKERPIQILVDALKDLGADIQYLKKVGFPPILIKGKRLTKSKVALKANVSSQYISALLLIASKLNNGLELTLEGKMTSVPYINMTLKLLNQIGISTSFEGNVITVKPLTYNSKPKTLTVESDWSSASYWYSIVALSDLNTKITLTSYKENSLQGDSVLGDIYKLFGVETQFNNDTITLHKTSITEHDAAIKLDLTNAPDIAQTIAVTAFGHGLECHLTGLHTLKIKETDRLNALKTELSKLGADIRVSDNALHIQPHQLFYAKNKHKQYKQQHVFIETYNDHRMAMAFAPLALQTSIIINDAHVVSKSYPDFWKDITRVGFLTEEL